MIKKVGVIGAGVIGASWSTLFLAKGLDVIATDPAPGAEQALRDYLAHAWLAMESLGAVAPDASMARLSFTANIEDIAAVDFVQENGPERLPFKQELYQRLDELLPPATIIASSSSGLTMTEIQKGCAQPPGALPDWPPFQSPASDPAGRTRRRQNDLAGDGGAGGRLLYQPWQTHDSRSQGSAGACGEPPAGRRDP
jgi:hypothetical protein